MDDDATHKTPEVKAWLENNPRFHAHFTPTSGSWLNLVEVWFGIIDTQAIRRGIFTSAKDLSARIRQLITGWNATNTPSSGPNAGADPHESQPQNEPQKRDIGPYWTRTDPSRPVQSIVDSALDQTWGKKAMRWVQIKSPAVTKFHEGVAAPQGVLLAGVTRSISISMLTPVGW